MDSPDWSIATGGRGLALLTTSTPFYRRFTFFEMLWARAGKYVAVSAAVPKKCCKKVLLTILYRKAQTVSL